MNFFKKIVVGAKDHAVTAAAIVTSAASTVKGEVDAKVKERQQAKAAERKGEKDDN